MDEMLDEEKREMFELYNSALKITLTKVEILDKNYKFIDGPNPIDHIKSRVKSIDSLLEKLRRKNIQINMENIRENIEDIAGIRIICSFESDVYKIAELIKKQEDITFVREQDYIAFPKPNGYRSYHMIIKVPVYLIDRVELVKVEIQIRTDAMDFWASLEHKARYKYKGDVPEHLIKELKVCAEKIHELDGRMYLISDLIHLINE